MLTNRNPALSGRLQELKNKLGTMQLVILKVVVVAYGSGRLQEFLITDFEWQYKQGFIKMVVTRAGRLREYSCKESFDCIKNLRDSFG